MYAWSIARVKCEEPTGLMQRDFGLYPQRRRQRLDLSLTQRSELCWHELLFLEELEHRRPSVMAGEIVGCPRKSCRPRPILHPPTRRLGQIRKLAEPASKHRTESRIGREAPKCIAPPQPAGFRAPAPQVRPRPPLPL